MNQLFNDLINSFIVEQSSLLDGFENAGYGTTVFGFVSEVVAKVPELAAVIMRLYDYFKLFGISVIVYVALSKGFTTYVLEKGDIDESPLSVLRNTLLALVVAVCSTDITKIYSRISLTICTEIINIISFSPTATSAMSGNVIVGFAWMICEIIIVLQVISRGVEYFILDLGLPIAACGLIKSDNGLFAQFVKKGLAITFTTIIQIGLMRIAILMSFKSLSLLYPLAILGVAIKGPKLLNEYLMPAGTGNGIHKVQSGLMIANSLKGLFR